MPSFCISTKCVWAKTKTQTNFRIWLTSSPAFGTTSQKMSPQSWLIFANKTRGKQTNWLCFFGEWVVSVRWLESQKIWNTNTCPHFVSHFMDDQSHTDSKYLFTLIFFSFLSREVVRMCFLQSSQWQTEEVKSVWSWMRFHTKKKERRKYIKHTACTKKEHAFFWGCRSAAADAAA